MKVTDYIALQQGQSKTQF